MRNSREYRTPQQQRRQGEPGGALGGGSRSVELAGDAVGALLLLAAEGLDLQTKLLAQGAADEAPHGVGLMPMSA